MKGKRKSLDRISFLPQETIEKILTHMPIRDALRTSILSRKWRYSWRTIPKLVFDEDSLVESAPPGKEELDKYKFLKAIFHVLLLHSAPILEFGLIVDTYLFEEINPIILHLSMTNNIKKFVFENLHTESYLLPCSLFSLQGLEHLHLRYCEFELPLMNKGFSKLKCLHFYSVPYTNEMVFEFLANCPLLEEFHWSIGWTDIGLTECELVELFKCIPLVQVLEISKLDIKHLDAGDHMPQKLPISLPNLRILDLSVCFLELSTVVCVISSCPNLEKIDIKCWDPYGGSLYHTCENLLDPQDYPDLNLDHLKELEITSFHKNHAPEMEFVKLIMAKSPVLKKALIKPSRWASPAGSFIIERPKD